MARFYAYLLEFADKMGGGCGSSNNGSYTAFEPLCFRVVEYANLETMFRNEAREIRLKRALELSVHRNNA